MFNNITFNDIVGVLILLPFLYFIVYLNIHGDKWDKEHPMGQSSKGKKPKSDD